MKPRASAGRPASAGPSSAGTLMTASARSGGPGSTSSSPSRISSGRVSVHSATPRASSISRSAAPAAAPKSRSGSASGVTSASVASLDPAVAQVDGGHHRELVDGQRPRGPGGDREHEPPRLAALDRVEHRGDLGGLGRARRR